MAPLVECIGAGATEVLSFKAMLEEVEATAPSEEAKVLRPRRGRRFRERRGVSAGCGAGAAGGDCGAGAAGGRQGAGNAGGGGGRDATTN